MTLPTLAQVQQRRWLYPNLWNGRFASWCPSIQGGGTTLYDLSGNGSPLAITNGTWSGRALSFNGTSTKATNTNLNRTPTGYPFAINVWINSSAANNATILTLGATSHYAGLYYSTTYGIVPIYQGSSSEQIRPGQTAFPGTWTMYTFAMYSATVGGLYLNGGASYVGQMALAFGTGTFNQMSLGFFSSISAVYYSGLMDDISVFDRVLTPGELSQMYRLGRGGSYAQLPVSRNYPAAAASPTYHPTSTMFF